MDAAGATRWVLKQVVAGEIVKREKSGVLVIVVRGLDEQRQAEANEADETQNHGGVILHFAGLDESKHAA